MFACGRNKCGQLGLGNTEDSPIPLRVKGKFLDEEVMQADGGKNHSIAVTASGSVFVWGGNEKGQLGVIFDCKVREPRVVSNGLPKLPVAFVSAGGDHCIAVFYSTKDVRVHQNRNANQCDEQEVNFVSREDNVSENSKECELLQPAGYSSRPMELPPLLELAEKVVKRQQLKREEILANKSIGLEGRKGPKPSVHNSSSSSEELALIAAIENIFFNVGFLSAGFTLPPEVIPISHSGFESSSRPIHSGLDVESIEVVYQTFLKTYSTDIIAALANASGALLDQLLERFEVIEMQRDHYSHRHQDDNSFFVEERELKALVILLQSPLLGTDSVYRDYLCSRAYECVMRLPPGDQQRLSSWIACYPSEVFVSRLVRPCQKYLTEKIQGAKHVHTHALFDIIYTAIVAIGIYYRANEVRFQNPNMDASDKFG